MDFTEHEPKLCCNCAYLIGRRTNLEAAKEWKCGHMDNLKEMKADLVTGGALYIHYFETCYEARSLCGGCGPLGQWYKKYEYVPHNPSGLNLGRPRKQNVSAPRSVEDMLNELEMDDEPSTSPSTSPTTNQEPPSGS